MKLRDYLKIAFGNLKRRRLRSWLTLLGIFVGVAAIVALIALGQGLQSAIEEQFAGLGLNTLTVQGAGSSFGPPGSNSVGKLGDHDIEILSRISGVDMVFPRYIKGTRIEYKNKLSGAFIASMPGGKEQKKIVQLLNLNTQEGRLINNDDKNKVTIGASIKVDNYKPQVGEKILIEGKPFQILGILEKKGNPMMDSAILMSEDAMKTLFHLNENYNLLIIAVKKDANSNDVKAVAERVMRKDRGEKIGDEDFDISSSQETLATFNEILTTVQILLVGIAAISLLVGAIGVLNTMYTAVLERRREIGIMKAIGAKNKDIQNIFLIESGLLGLTGGIIGLALGIGISKLIQFVAFLALGKSLIQATIPLWLVIGSLLFAFIIGTLSGTLPARQASKLSPVEALRK